MNLPFPSQIPETICQTLFSSESSMFRLDSPRLEPELSPVLTQLCATLLEAVASNSLDTCQSVLMQLTESTVSGESLKGPGGRTALHIAAEKGYFEVARLLLVHGNYFTLDEVDNSRRTPLHLACINRRRSVLRLLVQNGANVNVSDEAGNTPIHYAALIGDTETFDFLLKQDTDLRIRNLEGKSAIECGRLVNGLCRMNLVPMAYYPQSKWVELPSTSFISSLSSIDFEESLKSQLFDFDEEPEDFMNLKILGALSKGRYGEAVHLVKGKKEEYTLKTYTKSKVFGRNLYLKQVVAERNILSKVQSPFITHLHATHQTDEHLMLVLDFCSGGDLASKVKVEGAVTESEARLYLAEIVLAIEELHSKDVAYRNLKLKNIGLTSEGHIKLQNFVFSKENLSDFKGGNSFFMSITNLPPEVIQSEGHGKTVDLYMIGAVFFELVVGNPPKTPLSLPEHLSPACSSLIRGLMHAKANKRLTLAELKTHFFFKELDWKLVKTRQLPMPPSTGFDYSKLLIPDGYISMDHSSECSRLPGWSLNNLKESQNI